MTKNNIDTHPPVDPELLEQMRTIYSQYTGYQVAAVIGEIRREINAQRELDQLEDEIAALTLKLKNKKEIINDSTSNS